MKMFRKPEKEGGKWLLGAPEGQEATHARERHRRF